MTKQELVQYIFDSIEPCFFIDIARIEKIVEDIEKLGLFDTRLYTGEGEE